MELRALLFTSDSSSTTTLCRILTDLGIEAEICSEMLVAVERISRETYDALIVDWDLERDATLLLKTAREKRALGLNLALVQDDAAIARALQQGANSVIKKPVDAALAQDTLSTARDLILSRRTEQRDKESRIAASQAATEFTVHRPAAEESAPKSGFLPQTSTRSALEAEENIGKANTSAELHWQAARGPAALEQEPAAVEKEIYPVGEKRWDEVKTIFRETPDAEEAATPPTQDSTGIFSSLPEEPRPLAEPEHSSLPSYALFAAVAGLLVATVLYVWAPGDSYLGRVSSALHAFSSKERSSVAHANAPAPVPQTSVSERPSAGIMTPTGNEVPPDPGPIESTDVDPSKIRIIETKVIPKAGAQQPPTTDVPPPDPNVAHPPVQPDSNLAAPASPEAETPEAPTVAFPTAVSLPPQVARPQGVPRAPEISSPASVGRISVIIPDSLRNSPPPSPASPLEPFSVPEETSLGLLIQRVEPDYPAQALPQHLEGPVVLQAWITKDGTVRDLKLVRGYFVFGRAAIEAVKQWRFKPYSRDGRASDFQTFITVNFKYPGQASAN